MDTNGTLYLCATPIGNLEDITYRVLRTLKEVDIIAAEDTRNSVKLLNHFEIRTPMTSYHEYNKIEKAYRLIDQLKQGKNIALITDAGTPGISDPGEELVRIALEGLPGNVSRLWARFFLKEEKRLSVEVKDLGFGGFRASSGRVWKEEIELD